MNYVIFCSDEIEFFKACKDITAQGFQIKSFDFQTKFTRIEVSYEAPELENRSYKEISLYVLLDNGDLYCFTPDILKKYNITSGVLYDPNKNMLGEIKKLLCCNY